MPEKTVPLSVRLSSDEAAFLAGYNPPGATTLSEKLRAMIAATRRDLAKPDDFASHLDHFEDRLSVPVRRLRRAEHAVGMHSDLLMHFAHWLPEAIASFTAKVPIDEDSNVKEQLVRLEMEIADQVFTLFEQVLRLNVTGDSPCYDRKIINKRATSVVKLSELIKLSEIKK